MDIRAFSAWDLTTGSSSVIVGVIDSGIDYNHLDLAGNMWTNPNEIPGDALDNDNNGYVDDVHGINTIEEENTSDSLDVASSSHGTHVAGIIAAMGNNGLGVAGVTWQTQLVSLKFLDSQGAGTTADAIECINYALALKQSGVNLIGLNASWGGPAFSQALKDAIAGAGNAGILFIAAAGNRDSNQNLDRTPFYPASYDLPNLIAVSAIDRNGTLASFSNFGPNTVHLAAPGVDILSTTRSDTYGTLSGTSVATPFVTGTAALISAMFPSASATDIRSRILSSIHLSSSLSGLIVSGGWLDAAAALSVSLAEVPVISSISPTSVTEGSGDTEVHVLGGGFLSGAQVFVDGDALVTTWIAAGELSAVVPASYLTTPGRRFLQVRNPAPSGGVSNAVSLTVESLTPEAPVIDTLFPSEALPGSTVSVEMQGQNLTGASVTVDSEISVSDVSSSSTTITAVFTLSSAATVGPHTVTVTTAEGSTQTRFTVSPLEGGSPLPIVQRVSPWSLLLGQTRTITLQGNNLENLVFSFYDDQGVEYTGITVNNILYGQNNTRIEADFTVAPTAKLGKIQMKVSNTVGYDVRDLKIYPDNGSPVITEVTPPMTASGEPQTVEVRGKYLQSAVLEFIVPTGLAVQTSNLTRTNDGVDDIVTFTAQFDPQSSLVTVPLVARAPGATEPSSSEFLAVKPTVPVVVAYTQQMVAGGTHLFVVQGYHLDGHSLTSTTAGITLNSVQQQDDLILGLLHVDAAMAAGIYSLTMAGVAEPLDIIVQTEQVQTQIEPGPLLTVSNQGVTAALPGVLTPDLQLLSSHIMSVAEAETTFLHSIETNTSSENLYAQSVAEFCHVTSINHIFNIINKFVLFNVLERAGLEHLGDASWRGLIPGQSFSARHAAFLLHVRLSIVISAQSISCVIVNYDGSVSIFIGFAFRISIFFSFQACFLVDDQSFCILGVQGNFSRSASVNGSITATGNIRFDRSGNDRAPPGALYDFIADGLESGQIEGCVQAGNFVNGIFEVLRNFFFDFLTREFVDEPVEGCTHRNFWVQFAEVDPTPIPFHDDSVFRWSLAGPGVHQISTVEILEDGVVAKAVPFGGSVFVGGVESVPFNGRETRSYCYDLNPLTSGGLPLTLDEYEDTNGETVFVLRVQVFASGPPCLAILDIRPPQVTSFQSSVPSIILGQSFTLSWTTDWTNQAILAGNGIDPALQFPLNCVSAEVPNCPFTVTPTEPGTHPYTLQARSVRGDGSFREAVSELLVDVIGHPQFDSFGIRVNGVDQGQAATIIEGDQVTLVWTTSHAEEVSISGGNLSGTFPASGEANDTLFASTTYTLTATGAPGTTDATVTIPVTVSNVAGVLSAQPKIVRVGETRVFQIKVKLADGTEQILSNQRINYSLTGGGSGLARVDDVNKQITGLQVGDVGVQANLNIPPTAQDGTLRVKVHAFTVKIADDLQVVITADSNQIDAPGQDVLLTWQIFGPTFSAEVNTATITSSNTAEPGFPRPVSGQSGEFVVNPTAETTVYTITLTELAIGGTAFEQEPPSAHQDHTIVTLNLLNTSLEVKEISCSATETNCESTLTTQRPFAARLGAGLLFGQLRWQVQRLRSAATIGDVTCTVANSSLESVLDIPEEEIVEPNGQTISRLRVPEFKNEILAPFFFPYVFDREDAYLVTAIYEQDGQEKARGSTCTSVRRPESRVTPNDDEKGFKERREDALKNFAPVVLQEIDSGQDRNNGDYYEDFIIPWDFDGNDLMIDNSEHLSDQNRAQAPNPNMKGTLYTAAIETQLYYYFTYAYYHARDQKTEPFLIGRLFQHDNDMEGFMVVVQKGDARVIVDGPSLQFAQPIEIKGGPTADDFRSVDRVVLVKAFGHDDHHQHTLTGQTRLTFSNESQDWRVANLADNRQLLLEYARPVVYVQPHSDGHGGEVRATDDLDGLRQRIVAGEARGIVYTTVDQSAPRNCWIDCTHNETSASFQLRPFYDINNNGGDRNVELWYRRTEPTERVYSEENGLFPTLSNGSFQQAGQLYHFRFRGEGGLDNAAKPPWGWTCPYLFYDPAVRYDQSVCGRLTTDKGNIVREPNREQVPTRYLHNLYIQGGRDQASNDSDPGPLN